MEKRDPALDLRNHLIAWHYKEDYATTTTTTIRPTTRGFIKTWQQTHGHTSVKSSPILKIVLMQDYAVNLQ